jgi:hypothetical protein
VQVDLAHAFARGDSVWWRARLVRQRSHGSHAFHGPYGPLEARRCIADLYDELKRGDAQLGRVFIRFEAGQRRALVDHVPDAYWRNTQGGLGWVSCGVYTKHRAVR